MAQSVGARCAGCSCHRVQATIACQVSVGDSALCWLPPAGQNEQVRIALGQPPIRGRGLRVLAMDGGGMKVRWCNIWATLQHYN
jgi:hypothetical protein